MRLSISFRFLTQKEENENLVKFIVGCKIEKRIIDNSVKRKSLLPRSQRGKTLDEANS